MSAIRTIAALLVLSAALFCAVADVNATDIIGKYRTVRCVRGLGRVLELFSDGGLELNGDDILFDNEARCKGVVRLALVQPKTVAQRQNYGTTLLETDTSLDCGSNYGFLRHFEIFRPKKNVEFVVYDSGIFTHTITLQAGRKYVSIRDEFSQCVLVELHGPNSGGSRKESNSDGEREGASSSAKSSNDPTVSSSAGTSKEGENSTVVLWTWLGPLIGAVSTIVAAFIGVSCVKKRREVK